MLARELSLLYGGPPADWTQSGVVGCGEPAMARRRRNLVPLAGSENSHRPVKEICAQQNGSSRGARRLEPSSFTLNATRLRDI
jgi:hypothetical protein